MVMTSENYVGGSEIRGIQGSNNELKYVDCWSYDGYSMEEPYAPGRSRQPDESCQ